MKKSEQVALCGVVAALCTLLMFMTGMFPFSTYALPALAGLLMVTVAVEIMKEKLIGKILTNVNIKYSTMLKMGTFMLIIAFSVKVNHLTFTLLHLR